MFYSLVNSTKVKWAMFIAAPYLFLECRYAKTISFNILSIHVPI